MGAFFNTRTYRPNLRHVCTGRMYGSAYLPLVAKAVLKGPACCDGYVAFHMHMLLLYFSVSSWRKLWADNSVVASETHSFIVYMRQPLALYVTFLQEIGQNLRRSDFIINVVIFNMANKTVSHGHCKFLYSLNGFAECLLCLMLGKCFHRS